MLVYLRQSFFFLSNLLIKSVKFVANFLITLTDLQIQHVYMCDQACQFCYTNIANYKLTYNKYTMYISHSYNEDKSWWI